MRALRYAFRTLVKTPFVTLVAVVSLALGIGANTAIFSLFDQMLLRALPVEAPGELVNLSAPGPNPGSQSCNSAGSCQEVWSYPMFRDLEREQVSFTGIALHRLFGANFALAGSSSTNTRSRGSRRWTVSRGSRGTTRARVGRVSWAPGSATAKATCSV